MRPVVTAAEMRALDRATIEDIGIPAFTLMETAGRAVAHVAMEMLESGVGHVAVVCGPGNNGGDGFVAARVLRDLGLDAVVRMIDSPQALGELGDAIAGAALAVDALFGVGLSRPLEGHFADVVSLINHGGSIHWRNGKTRPKCCRS